MERGSSEENSVRIGFQFANVAVKDRKLWEAIDDEDRWAEILEELKINKIDIDNGVRGKKDMLPIRFVDIEVL